MNRLKLAEYARALSAPCMGAAPLAVVSLLWFMRAHVYNATNAGWGDQEQDRHQWMLGWGVRISAIVAMSCMVVVAIRSRRALIAMATGVAVSGLVTLAGPWFPYISVILGFPGWLATLSSFGVHGGGGYEVTGYFFVINACVYIGLVFLLLRKTMD